MVRLLSSLIYSISIMIFNHMIFASGFSFGGVGLKSFLIGNKLYFISSSDFFYADITSNFLACSFSCQDVLDGNAIIDQSQLVDLQNTRPDGARLFNSFLGGEANDKIFSFDLSSNDMRVLNIFDSTLGQWEIIQSQQLFINDWTTDEKTGKTYSLESINEGMSMFDTINLTFTKSNSNPRNLFADYFLYADFVQVLLPNGQILYIGGGDLGSIKLYMNSILTYNIITDSWQMTVWKSIFKMYQMIIDH